MAMEFKYESKSQPGKVWTATIERGQGVCDCIGYVNHQHCVHVDDSLQKVKDALGDVLQGALPAVIPPKVQPGPTAGVQIRSPHAMMPTRDEIRAMVDLANALSRAAGFAIPKHFDSSPKVFAAIYFGWELGIPPMAIIRQTFIVNGRIEPMAQLMMGLVQARDQTAEFRWIVEPNEETGAHVELWRRARKVSSGKWTPADAERSGQLKMPNKKVVQEWKAKSNGDGNYPVYAKDASGKDLYEDVPGNWQLYPTDMYSWAAVKRACRLGAADLLNAVEGFTLGGTLLAEAFSEEGGMGVDALMNLDPFTGELTGDPPPPPADTPDPTPPQQEEPAVASDTPSASISADPAPDRQESAPARPQGLYAWLPEMQKLREKEFKSITEDEITAFLHVEANHVLEGIDSWVWAEGQAANVPERLRGLLLAIIAKRTADRDAIPFVDSDEPAHVRQAPLDERLQPEARRGR